MKPLPRLRIFDTVIGQLSTVILFMVQAYNFLAAWQLFPEKGIYEQGERPKSGIYKIESPEGEKRIDHLS